MNEIGLVEIIDQIKAELNKAQADPDPLFALTNVEIDVSFTVTRTKDGRIDFTVVSGGMDTTSENTQRITIKLESLATPEQLRDIASNKLLYKMIPKLMRGEEEE